MSVIMMITGKISNKTTSHFDSYLIKKNTRKITTKLRQVSNEIDWVVG